MSDGLHQRWRQTDAAALGTPALQRRYGSLAQQNRGIQYDSRQLMPEHLDNYRTGPNGHCVENSTPTVEQGNPYRGFENHPRQNTSYEADYPQIQNVFEGQQQTHNPKVQPPHTQWCRGDVLTPLRPHQNQVAFPTSFGKYDKGARQPFNLQSQQHIDYAKAHPRLSGNVHEDCSHYSNVAFAEQATIGNGAPSSKPLQQSVRQVGADGPSAVGFVISQPFGNVESGALSATTSDVNPKGQGDSGTSNAAISSSLQYLLSSLFNRNSQTQPHQHDDSTNQGETFEDDPPLLEDLGIKPAEIWQRTKSVLLLKKIDHDLLVDSDMTGPILIGLLLGCLLCVSGKASFGYLYGLSIIGCFSTYILFNLMSTNDTIDLYRTASILGYSLLPVVGVAVGGIFLPSKSTPLITAAIIAILWCTATASRFFEAALRLRHQRFLIAYPVFLLYLSFVLITIL